MRYLFIAFLFVSLFGHSQGIEPSSFQGNPNKSGFLKSVTLNVDDFGDTTYLYVHVDSLSVLDSIYLQGDSLILLKNGSGQVYKNRIYTGLFSAYDVPNPQKYDIYVNADQTSYWWNGSDWVLFDGDTNPYNEGELTLHDIDPNVVGMRSSTNYFNVKNFVGLNGIQITTNELDSLNIGIDTTLFAGETQYLNPYVVTGDTTGFYLTVAQDTVLFLSTIDSTGVADSTSVVGGYGIDVVESPANVWTVGADTSQVATRHDLTLKENVLSFTSPLNRATNTISIPAATTSVSGHLTSTDWNIFKNKVDGSGTNTQAAYWTGSPATLTSNSSFTYASSQWNMLGRFDLRQTASNFSVCIGAGSGNVGTSTGGDNFWLGRDAGRVNTSGHSNFAGGVNCLYSNLTGYNNTAIGLNSMFYNTSGTDNLAMGSYSLASNTDGFYNTALAPTALFNNTSGYANVAIGYNSMLSNQTGISNLAAGWRSLYSNVSGGYNVSLGDFSLYNTTGGYNVGLGYYAGGQNTSASNRLYIENSNSETPLIGGDFSGNKVGINTLISSIDQTLDVTGTVRITGSDGTSTTIMGRDGDGDVSAITASSGITLASNTLKADTSVLATQYDLTQISGSSKAIDRLASDFATTATSLQTTNIDYTFPSTGLYHVVLIANFQTTNTNGGIKAAYAASGGLTYDFISGAHRAPIDIYDATTERVSSLETLTSGINTTGVNPSGTPHHLQSDMLINVTTAGTVTLTFASESGSYTATLKAGSTLIIEKLN